RHGSHHVAHTSRSTTFPRSDASVYGSPVGCLGSESSSGVAGFPAFCALAADSEAGARTQPQSTSAATVMIASNRGAPRPRLVFRSISAASFLLLQARQRLLDEASERAVAHHQQHVTRA